MLLEAYHRNVLQSDPTAKTVKLPSGTLIARKRPDNVEIDDEDAFLSWAIHHRRDEFIRIVPEKRSVDRNVVKEYALKHGEVLPGVTAITGDDAGITFKVEVVP
jgi:phage host-nuclease inhibitor protein Gam